MENPKLKIIFAFLVAILLIGGAWFYPAAEKKAPEAKEEKEEGVVLPVAWGDLGAKLASVGAIDAEKLKAVYGERGAFPEEYEALLSGQNEGNLKMTKDNAGYLLNLFWALGLASKNDILESGPMVEYGDTGNFASTGGWTIAKGGAMDHYSRHKFFNLTPEQQNLVEKVSRGIYRPCCNNPTHFPDCNHGMAMLGLLELMASQGVSEEEMYKTALQVNALWFPEEYRTIQKYLESKGISWDEADPKKILSAKYSSASGYQYVLSQLPPAPEEKGAGCGV